MLKLILEKGVVRTWEDFCKKTPPFSVALDGYVLGPTRYDYETPRLNINHHETVDRLSTRSAAAQVYMLIKQGLFIKFKKDNNINIIAYINDCDQDVAMAIWLLRNYKLIKEKKYEEAINNLVFTVDMLDSTAGTYPLDTESNIMRGMAWIFEPYTELRTSGKLLEISSDEMINVIELICNRVTDFIEGRGKEIELNANYEVISNGNGWIMINELGPYARTKLFAQGIDAFVSVRKKTNGKYVYTLIKRSQFINFPIEVLYNLLNRIEGISKEDTDRWGGGNTIGGSPRIKGSKIKPEELKKIIDDNLERYIKLSKFI